MASLTSQTVAESYEQLLSLPDGGGDSTTLVSITDGDAETTFSFQISTNALMMTSTNQLQFGDTGTYIHQSANGVLDLVSDSEIEINATTIDINGAVAMDGAMTGGTNITISGELDAATLDISGNADIDGTLEADVITVDGSSLASVIQAQTVDLATSFTVSANNSADETVYPLFVDGATGTQGAESDTGLTYNPSTGVITSTQFTGNVTGNVTGNTSGTAATVTGGTQASITSAANLVTVGTIGTGVWQGTEVGLGYGGTELVGETDGKIVIADGSGAPVHLDVGSSTAITILGTVGTGVWQGTAIASAYLDSDTAHLSGTQTFSGAKSFSADATHTGNIIIDANDKALVLGADQDASIFSNAAGEIFFVRGQDYDVGADDNEGWISMTIGFDSATTLSILGGETGSSTILMHSDGGDDDADKWKLDVADGGAFTMNYASTGSYVTHLKLDANSRISLSNNDSGTSNTVFGYQAGNLIGSGDNYNVFIGHQVADADMTNATKNVGVGTFALGALTTGDGNVAIGYSTGYTLTTSSDNILIGDAAGEVIAAGQTTTDGTVAIGKSALAALTDGAGNVAVGYQSGDALTTGGSNVLIGYDAGGNFDAEDYNVAIGRGTFNGAVNGASNCVAIGGTAMQGAATQVGTIAIGHNALNAVTSGANNTMVGYHAGKFITTGAGNTGLGYGTMDEVPVAASYNTALGFSAMGGDSDSNTASDYNTAVGAYALNGVMNEADNNTAIGYQAGTAITTGDNNIAIGANALDAETTGNENIAIGKNALGVAANGELSNVVIGNEAGNAINDAGADYNVIIGSGAGQGGTGAMAQCVAIGLDAMNSTAGNAQAGTVAIGSASLTALTSGAGNIAIGYQALNEQTDGARNTAIGYQAIKVADSGESSNTAVGYQALLNLDASGADENTCIGNIAGTALTTGSDNTLIGSEAAASAVGASNQTVIGKSAVGKADNSVMLGNTSVLDVYIAGMNSFRAESNVLYVGSATVANKNTALQLRANDAPALHIDSSQRVGIGTTTPTSKLEIATDTDDTVMYLSTHHDTDSAHPNLIFRKSGGSEASPTVVADNEFLGDIEWHAYDGDSYGQSAVIRSEIDGAVGDGDVNGNLIFMTTVHGSQASSERMRIDSAGNVGIGTNAPDAPLHINTTATGTVNMRSVGSHASFAGHLFRGASYRVSSDAWVVFEAYHGDGSTDAYVDPIFQIEGNGDVESDTGSYGTGAADYAEYFESTDGSALPVGSTVVLENGKVKVASSGETPIGVVRPPQGSASVIGNKAQQAWHGKWKRDDYGGIILDENNNQIMNDSYNTNQDYTPREKRDEWNLIGLLGQIPITKGQPIGNWIKMKDVSDAVEMYFVK